MAATPVFAVTPRIGVAALTSADTSYTSPTNVVTVLSAATSGTRVAEVVVQMTAAVGTATMVRLFVHDGSSAMLFDEVGIAAATGTTSVKQTRVSTLYSNLVLPNNNWSLRATVHTSNAGVVTALGADL
jgi:hypothetical protein